MDQEVCKNDASILLPKRDDPKTDQPPHIVPGKTSIRSAIPQSLYDQAKKQGWTVIGIKTDWKRIFAFEQ
ncbi:MAG TPA: hypothetical protein HPP90_09865 [Deltaproteobacteria bacterium]|nr:hypothetical protein [Deltaproteobacteria bacterium]